MQVASVEIAIAEAQGLGLRCLPIKHELNPENGPPRSESAFYDYDANPIVIFDLKEASCEQAMAAQKTTGSRPLGRLLRTGGSGYSRLEPGKALIKTWYLGVAPVMLRYMQNETDFESALALGDL